MKKSLFFTCLAISLALLSSCMTVPVAVTSGEIGPLKGESSSVKLFEIIPISGENTIARAAEEGGITNITTVEYQQRHLGIFGVYTTIVTGTGPSPSTTEPTSLPQEAQNAFLINISDYPYEDNLKFSSKIEGLKNIDIDIWAYSTAGWVLAAKTKNAKVGEQDIIEKIKNFKQYKYLAFAANDGTDYNWEPVVHHDDLFVYVSSK